MQTFADAIQSANEAWDVAEAIAWNPYVSAADAALTTWVNSQTAAENLLNNSLATAEAAWNVSEQAAWHQHQLDVQSAEAAWNSREAVAWSQYVAETIAALATWDSAEAVARAQLLSVVQAARYTWESTESVARSEYLSDIQSATDAWAVATGQPWLLGNVEMGLCQIDSMSSKIAQAAARGDIATLETMLESGALNQAGRAAVQAAIQRLKSSVQQIIAKECKRSILREFPSQWLKQSLKTIQESAKSGDKTAQKALKILTDKRFKK
jgi:hypothetical protein